MCSVAVIRCRRGTVRLASVDLDDVTPERVRSAGSRRGRARGTAGESLYRREMAGLPSNDPNTPSGARRDVALLGQSSSAKTVRILGDGSRAILIGIDEGVHERMRRARHLLS